ncbi:rod shape-determining protein MreC [Candidatus Kaiserbacteria bacterium]|nr:rod shape-determining protein MreC [Candidatus Kaiserbacteria bacterium]
MKTNSRRSSRNAWRRGALVFLFACVGLGLLFSVRGGMAAVGGVIFSPIVSVRAWLWESGGAVPVYFRTRHSLDEQIIALEDELRRTADDAWQVRQLQAENEELSALLGFRKETYITAGVLSRPNQTPYDTFLIDRGMEDGIVENAIVYVEDNAVGSVIRVYAHSALVLLVSAPGVHTTAYLTGPKIFVQGEGKGGGVLRLSVPQGIPLAEGDVALLPGAGRGAYGKVVHMESLSSNPEQYAYVTTSIPLSAVRFVHVAKEPASHISYEEALEAVTAAPTALFQVEVPPEAHVAATSTPEAPPEEAPAQ